MGIFSKLFGNQKQDSSPEDESPVIYVEQDERMERASEEARSTFKYFWRELYWENRRIIKAHDFAMVKFPFMQTFSRQKEPVVEHMWVNNINFDGELISGELANAPHQLTNIKQGATVMRPLDLLGDWMFSVLGKTHGGFSVQEQRRQMDAQQRKAHDEAWGLDFGDPEDVLIVYKQKEEPDNLGEHPMSKNMEEKVREFLVNYPDEITHVDELGQTMLHREAIAGNLTAVRILLEKGADKSLRSQSGKTPQAYAQAMGWEHLEGIW
ncbi:MAG TPA: hypothetical protein DCR93_06055 [Cytophagales bacterium]|nr:hypothetical protein [Cytophagales bacterium]HAP59075.1 hypothetical protein [Cytophagales bacterium]